MCDIHQIASYLIAIRYSGHLYPAEPSDEWPERVLVLNAWIFCQIKFKVQKLNFNAEKLKRSWPLFFFLNTDIIFFRSSKIELSCSKFKTSLPLIFQVLKKR